MRICVIGAGIIGAACAAELARQGATVQVLDAGVPGATAASFGWINASFHLDAAHFRLRQAGMDAYRRLLAHTDLPISSKTAFWWEQQGPEMDRFAEYLRAGGYDVAELDQAALQFAIPSLSQPPARALLFRDECAVDPSLARHVLLQQAQQHGAQMVRGVQAEAITTQAGRVTGVTTSHGPIACDTVLIAAGTGAPELLASVGLHLPMKPRPAVSVITAPVDLDVPTILVTPEGEVRQRPDGRLISPTSVNHQGDNAEAITAPLNEIADQTCARIAPLFGWDHLPWSQVHVADRPVPDDDRPVIGAAGPKGLHVAVMHSGITLAAITAELTAAAMLGQLTAEQGALIAPYSPHRFDPR